MEICLKCKYNDIDNICCLKKHALDYLTDHKNNCIDFCNIIDLKENKINLNTRTICPLYKDYGTEESPIPTCTLTEDGFCESTCNMTGFLNNYIIMKEELLNILTQKNIEIKKIKDTISTILKDIKTVEERIENKK